ncbi:MAG: transposase family protein [Desulfobacula sp.]|nr:transposase family protein [Desulfobacula sp.]
MNCVAESQLSEALDIGARAVRLRAVKESWPVVRKPKQGGNEVSFVRDLLPLNVQKSLVVRESVTGAVGFPNVIHDTPVPKRSNKIGLAKYNLVHAFRLAKEQAGWGQKGKAAQDFLLAYNTGLLLPGVFKEVGQIKERTLDALDKKLRNNDDNYLALCDGRGGWKKHGTNKYKGRKLSETAKAEFLKCYLSGNRPSVAMAIISARATLKNNNEPVPVSDSTFARWLKDYEKYNAGVICLAREGMKMYQDKYGPYISRDGSLLNVGQCLVADGKTLNFFILHPETGRPCRMTLIVFFDWASRYPCGWHIMPSEDQYGILSAFRNAVETLGRYPESVYLDNGRAFKSKLFTKTDPDFSEMTGLYARVGTAVMFAKPYNGRAKVVERFFKTFQSQLEFMMPSYCGDSIQTKPPWMHRNEKFQKAWHKARTQNWIPNIREAAVIIDRYFQWYAQQSQDKLPATPADMFLSDRGPGVDQIQLNYDFLLRKEVRPRNCRITLWKIEYEADCLHNLSRQEPIWAAVNTADLRKIWCYTKDGIYLGEAYPVRACHPLARLFGDQVAIDQVITENKRQARLAKNTKQQLEYLGITKETDSLDGLPFAAKKEKTLILPAGKTAEIKNSEPQKKLSNKKVKRLEMVMAKAEQEKNTLPEIPRPKYWASGLEHYEWCFKMIHEHGRELREDDVVFMKQFEALSEFDGYRQRFEDLKSIYK